MEKSKGREANVKKKEKLSLEKEDARKVDIGKIKVVEIGEGRSKTVEIQ